MHGHTNIKNTTTVVLDYITHLTLSCKYTRGKPHLRSSGVYFLWDNTAGEDRHAKATWNKGNLTFIFLSSYN
jgi:hypothetical protein